MRTRGIVSIGALFLGAACAAKRAGPSTGEWSWLGQRQVSGRANHDLIPVTASRGDFRRVKLVVKRNPVNFRRLVVHYGSGASREVELGNTIPAGGESRPIELGGSEHDIRGVELWYEPPSQARSRMAIVRLYGLH